MNEPKPDPGLYRKLSAPFATFEAADAALDLFFKELGELRAKHNIRDLHCIISSSAITDGGKEGDFITSLHYGDSSKAEVMTGWALGKASSERQQMIAEVITDAGKSIKRKKNQ